MKKITLYVPDSFYQKLDVIQKASKVIGSPVSKSEIIKRAAMNYLELAEKMGKESNDTLIKTKDGELIINGK